MKALHTARRVDFGDLRRLHPVSRKFGFDRGTPIDRYYNQRFFFEHRGDIAGRVLEVGDDHTSRRFGGERVEACDVLNLRPGVPGTTIVGDLAAGSGFPNAAFDCIIIENTLQLIFEVGAALRTLKGMLRPGGILLLTVSGTIANLPRGGWHSSWCWGFTAVSISRLLADVFRPEHCEVTQFGNVLSSTAFLQGIAAEELTTAELDFRDACYPLLLAARVRR
jgi:SAM-dependent methyltransferase